MVFADWSFLGWGNQKQCYVFGTYSSGKPILIASVTVIAVPTKCHNTLSKWCIEAEWQGWERGVENVDAHLNVITLAPIRKVWSFLCHFSQNSQILKSIALRFSVPKFTQIRWKMWKIQVLNQLHLLSKLCLSLHLFSQNSHLTTSCKELPCCVSWESSIWFSCSC